MPLRLKRRPKTPYWIIRGTIRGIRVEESTGTSDRRVAEEIRAKREAEILAQSVYGRRATATFASAALSYLEHGGSKRFTAPVISHFGTTPLAQIEQDALDAAAKKLFPNALRSRLLYCTMQRNGDGARGRSFKGPSSPRGACAGSRLRRQIGL